MADPPTKKFLHDLSRDGALQNKSCADCGSPNPQWASVSFAIFICLQCAGLHRGFGVHISFVRSISMDAWQDDQLRRMKLGGNAPLIAFLREYPPTGGYSDGISVHDKYHCWAATQYREKLTALVEGKEWSPSPPPPPPSSAAPDTVRPPSAQGLRKSRAATRSRSHSPAPASNDAKSATNESYFATLGASNAARPAGVPPAQGGRYTGFGNTPDPADSAPPSVPLPLQEPLRVLSRGWTMFAGAVVERATDPELRARVGEYVGAAGRRAAAAAESANAWSRERLGVDVGAVVEAVKGGPPGRGYEAVDQWGWGAEEERSAVYAEAAEDEFFKADRDGDDARGPRDVPTAARGEGDGDGDTRGGESRGRDTEWEEWKE